MLLALTRPLQSFIQAPKTLQIREKRPRVRPLSIVTDVEGLEVTSRLLNYIVETLIQGKSFCVEWREKKGPISVAWIIGTTPAELYTARQDTHTAAAAAAAVHGSKEHRGGSGST